MIELLLANHPLDCPVCDKGGECPLQDQAFSHGPGESRYVEQKRHYAKPIPISDHVLLDRERCILCDRCTRFADEVAGDKLIHFIDRGNATQVNTFPDEPFSSYFSGNTVQICPVGALTAKPYRFKARPWDLEQVESTCTTCSVGCRISVHSSRDELLRFQGVDSRVGQLGLDVRPRPVQLRGARLRPSHRRTRWCAAKPASPRPSWSSAMTITAQLLRDAAAADGGPSIGLIGGARGTNERCLRLGAARRRRSASTGAMPSSATACPPRSWACPAPPSRRRRTRPTVILVGPDLKEELPVLYLRLRDAVEKGRTKLIEFSSQETGMTRLCVARVSGTHPAWRARRDRQDARRPRRRRAAGVGRRRHRRRSQQPRGLRVDRAGGRSCGARRRSRAPRCCRRCGAATSSVRSSSVSPRVPPATTRCRRCVLRRRQARRARAPRRRPDQRLPGRRSRPPSARRRPSHHLDRHVHVRVDAAGRRRAPGGGVRRADRHDHQPGGSRVSRSTRR